MTTVGQRERATQQRVVRFFIEELGYRYLGDWHTRPNNRNVEPDLLSHWLIDRGVERATQQRVVRFFIEELGYRYLGDWHTRPNNRNVEPDLLSHWLIDRGVVD